jgi:hypothetical protein
VIFAAADTRLTSGFSRKIENHMAMVSLFFTFYNFGRVRQTLRVTPEMEAGISDHAWSVEEIVAILGRCIAVDTSSNGEPFLAFMEAPAHMPANVGRLTAIVVLSIALARCSSPASPSSTGTWSGQITDDISKTGTITLTMTQSGSSLSGTFAVTGLVQPLNNESGSLSGNVASAATSMTLTPSDPGRCVLTVSATVSGSQMNAGYASPGCNVIQLRTGSFVVNKQ